jgi:hypothetical protein
LTERLEKKFRARKIFSFFFTTIEPRQFPLKGSMTLIIMTINIMTFCAMMRSFSYSGEKPWQNQIENNDIEHNQAEHHCSERNIRKHYGTEQNDIA